MQRERALAPVRPYDALLLDFGGVCLLNPAELHEHLERRLGLPGGTFQWRGPADPLTDELWQRMTAGEGVTERQYWQLRAAEVGRAVGQDWTLADYMRQVFVPPEPWMVRTEAVDVVERALAAGFGVSVLTNDLRAFHGPHWELEVDLLQRMDHIVDCSDTGILKPDRRAYQRAVEITGVPAERQLFVDDLPLNVQGAEAVGMDAVWFDIAHPAESWAAVASRLGV